MMPITSTVKASAAGDHGCMTLGELAAFVAACQVAEVPIDSLLQVRVRGFTGRLAAIEPA